MNGKILFAFIGVFLLLLFTGIYFAYNAITTEELPGVEKEELHSSEKELIANSATSKSNNKSSTASSSTNNQNTSNSKNSTLSNSNPTSSESSAPVSKNYNSHEVVVDQTLQRTGGQSGGGSFSKDVIPDKKEKVEIEITIYDGEENKLLESYLVQVKYEFIGDPQYSEKCVTDKEGKFILNAGKTGLMRMQIFSKDFSMHSKSMNVLYGKNVYRAKLYKGGVIEIHAKNTENKVVQGLSAKIGNGFRPPQAQESMPITLDPNKGVYFMSNVPVGTMDISFKAIGCQETDVYKIRVDSKSTSLIEVRMQSTRLIFFDLDIKNKPDLIYVTNLKTGNATVSNIQTQPSRLPNRNLNTPNKGVPGPLLPVEEKIEVFKNQNGLYECELTVKNVTRVTLEVDKYVPKDVSLSADKDTYKINLIEGFSGKLQINNEIGVPISGAAVAYSSGAFNQVALSDEKGVAILSGMTEHMMLRLIVTHNQYAVFNEKWSFDANEQNAKTIVMKEGKGISGRIKFEEKFVAGAKVFLYQKGKTAPVEMMDSGSDGSYSFNKLDGKTDSVYIVSAFHRELGAATSGEIKIESKNPVVDLTLVKEKSLTVKLVDSKGVFLPNKNITVTNDADSNYSFSVMTDEKGEYEFFNLIHGQYSINLNESKIKCHEVKTTIPAGVITLTARSKNLKKVNITVSGSKSFTAELKVTLERNDWPIVVVQDEEGYFVEFQEEEPVVFVIVAFHAQGYGDVRMGPYENKESLPKEFNIEFHMGENFIVKVIDDADSRPIPFITVDVYSGRNKIEALPANDLGEIRFSYLSGKFVLNVKEDGYAPYSGEFDGTQTKELTVRLIKGGGIKGHLTLKKEVSTAFIIIKPGDISQKLDSLGNFEVLNLIPGEYEISVSRIFKDGKNQIEKIPARIMVERESIFEINLDDYQKNQTSLEVSVIKDGSPSLERGWLNITDRRGQSVVAASIDTGKYVVERILPAEYLLIYNYQGKTLQRTLAIIPNQVNAVEIIVPGASITFSIKNAEGMPISKVMVTLYTGEKYRQEDTYIGNQMLTDTKGTGTFLLMPRTPYYFLVEEDFRFNYQINMIGPVILDAGQSQRVDYILPYARKLPKIQVVDNANKPLADVGFLFNDEAGNFYQRTLLKEWDFFPYSNVEGFLPENSWPKVSFTLVVGKEGFEFKEIPIPSDYDVNQLMQIKLNRASSLKCTFPQTLPLPISVGILNKDGVLLQKPIPYPMRKNKELTIYYENITSGSVNFTDLAAGTYFIGYFWNGSNRLISKQGPFQVGVEENQVMTSTLQLNEY
jgi:hypothetical protein